MLISLQRYPLDSSLSFIACVSIVWGEWGVSVTELHEKREKEPVSMFKTLREARGCGPVGSTRNMAVQGRVRLTRNVAVLDKTGNEKADLEMKEQLLILALTRT